MAKTFWSDTLLVDDIGVTSFHTESLLQQTTRPEQRIGRWTLLRTIIGLDIGATVHDSGEGSSTIDIGIGIASQEAFLAGVFPDPNNATDFPTRGWIFRARGRIFGFDVDQPTVYSWRVDRDIRSRRVLDNGEPYVIFTNGINDGGTVVARVTGLIRCLWLVR